MSGYIGRFAPSPTGPLHMGSLFAALVSYLDARSSNGLWLLRIEDIDPPREDPNSVDHILRTLQSHGMHWDGDVVYQSHRSALYERRLSELFNLGLCFACPCSRKILQEAGGEHLPSCGMFTRERAFAESALRVKSTIAIPQWNDIFLGSQSLNTDQDFILKRRDGLYAYQLACVSDDIEQKVTHVIRGADLLDSTPIQLGLLKALGCPTPSFGHFPLILSDSGQKLSKQNLAPAVSPDKATENLHQCAKWLGITIPVQMGTPNEILSHLVEQWQRKSLIQQDDFYT